MILLSDSAELCFLFGNYSNRSIHVENHRKEETQGTMQEQKNTLNHADHHSMHHSMQHSDIHPKRMEVWYAGLDRMTGSFVQGGNRPVLIVSNDVNNAVSPLVTVIPMTSKPKKMYLPTHVWIESDQMIGVGKGNTAVASGLMLAEQITTIDKHRLLYRMCEVKDEAAIKRIEHSVNIQLGMTGS